jgi:uncharacterized protein (TIGR03086 family)
MDLVELHGRCGDRFAGLVAGTRAEQWQNETPCSEWDVRTLVHHVFDEQLWVEPLFAGLTISEIGNRFEGDLMGDDASTWEGLVASSIDEAHAAIAQPNALQRTVHLSFGDTSGEEYVTQLIADLAIHGWDLARATWQEETIDVDAVELLLPWAEANADLLTGSGMFGAPVNPAPDDPEDARLLGLVGRHA